MLKKLLLYSFIFLSISGCMAIDVHQRLKRSGTYDLAITFSTSPEYKILLSGLEDDIRIADEVLHKSTIRKTDTSVSFILTDLEPQTDRVLFRNSGPDEQTFLSPDQITFTSETGPFSTTYTYSIRTPPTDTIQGIDPTKNIIDDAGMLSPDDIGTIASAISSLHSEHAIETMVITKENMSMLDYAVYSQELRSGNEGTAQSMFPNPKKIILFASPGSYCTLDISHRHTLTQEAILAYQELSDKFSSACPAISSTDITQIVRSLDQITATDDLDGIKDIMEQFVTDIFTVTYTVETFGRIVHTNGDQIDRKTVRFRIDPTDPETEYHVVFKDHHLAGILGDFWWAYLGGILMIPAGMIAGAMMTNMKRPRKKPAPYTLPSNPRLIEYISRARSRGTADRDIRARLLNAGWLEQDIDRALHAA